MEETPMTSTQESPSLITQIKRSLPRPEPLRRLRRYVTGYGNPNWSRVVMMKECASLIEELGPAKLDTLEISGTNWKDSGFRSYRDIQYPEYDACESALDERFDLIIAEQVFEHVLWPYRAGRNVFEMLRPGGHFLMSTPFLYRIHEGPQDCSRWSEIGMRHFLSECGFPIDDIVTDSWGNLSCVKAFLTAFVPYRPWQHSLANDPSYPVAVWALAKRAPAAD